MNILEMTPRRPHLFKATYEWLLENELTPYLLVDTTVVGVDVPMEQIQDDQIILNLAPQAIGNYEMTSHRIAFSARFNGAIRQITVPMSAIRALYAKENGVGMGFEEEPQYVKERAESEAPKKKNPFTLVK